MFLRNKRTVNPTFSPPPSRLECSALQSNLFFCIYIAGHLIDRASPPFSFFNVSLLTCRMIPLPPISVDRPLSLSPCPLAVHFRSTCRRDCVRRLNSQREGERASRRNERAREQQPATSLKSFKGGLNRIDGKKIDPI